jgi:hypothetical protein
MVDVELVVLMSAIFDVLVSEIYVIVVLINVHVISLRSEYAFITTMNKY